MFTGIVEELGRIDSFADGRLRIAATTVLDDVASLLTALLDLHRARMPQDNSPEKS